MKKIYLLMILLIMTAFMAYAQVAINANNSAPDPSAMLDVKSTSKGFLPPRMTTFERDAITQPVAGLTIYNTWKHGNETYDGSSWISNTHYISEIYGGGIVFYIYDHGQHGLIAATEDQSTGVQWYNGTNRITGTTGDGINAGAMNTAMIVAGQMADNQGNNFAAKVCADYSVTLIDVTIGDYITIGDWYLPSKYELNLLYQKKDIIGGFSYEFYWSSTECGSDCADGQDFSNGYQGNYIKNDGQYVRAIRAF